MLRTALAFFVLSLIAYVLGATGVAGASMNVGRVLLIGFLVLSVVGVTVELIRGRRPNDVR